MYLLSHVTLIVNNYTTTKETFYITGSTQEERKKTDCNKQTVEQYKSNKCSIMLCFNKCFIHTAVFLTFTGIASPELILHEDFHLS